jgi:predicted RNA polymerase sigma factor
VRAHLLERAGDVQAAIVCFERAAARTTSSAEQNYLRMRAARVRARC